MIRRAALWRRLLLGFAAVAGVMLVGGCATGSPESKEDAGRRIAAERERSAKAVKESVVHRPREVSIPELDALTFGYADRFYMVISSATDAIKRDNPDPVQRRRAHQIKLQGVLSMNDIVSGNDPYAQIFDLVVSVTLQSIQLIDEDEAEKVFGARAPGLITAIHTMRAEAWDLAARVLRQEQLELLDYIILEWRRTHRDIEQVAYVKFDNFAGTRSDRLLSDLRAGGGFLAPISETNQVLKDWGRLSERAFWYSKRAPNIAAIQAEDAVNEILAAPEINSALQTADRLGRTAEAAPQIIDAQREALFADLDARQGMVAGTLGDVRKIVTEADALVGVTTTLTTNVQQTLAMLGDTLKIADQVGRTYGMDKPSARPFDIQEYTGLLTRLNEVVTNMHQLSRDADYLARSDVLKNAVQDISDAADRRVDRVFVRLAALLGAAFVLALAYRFLSLKFARRTAPTGPDAP